MPTAKGLENEVALAEGREDKALVEACLRGDASAWDELVERYGRLVYSIPRKLGLSDSDADDVFQVVFGIVLRRLETLRDVDRLSAWLIRTTYRESWRLGKRRRRERPDELPAGLSDDGEPTEEQTLALERQQLVRQALGQIDPRCRALLEALFFCADTPDYQAIAEKLNMKIGSIGPTRARCFQKLEALLRRAGL